MVGHVFVTPNDCVERPDTQRCSIAHLRPVVTQALGNDRYQLLAEMFEALNLVVWIIFYLVFKDPLAGNKDGIYHEVRDFAHKSVEVIDCLQNDCNHGVEVETVESVTNAFDDGLKDSHGGL